MHANAYKDIAMYTYQFDYDSFQFHWNLFPTVQLIILQHCFRQWFDTEQATSHDLSQWWPNLPTHLRVMQSGRVSIVLYKTISFFSEMIVRHYCWLDVPRYLARSFRWFWLVSQDVFKSLMAKEALEETCMTLQSARHGGNKLYLWGTDTLRFNYMLYHNEFYVWI